MPTDPILAERARIMQGIYDFITDRGVKDDYFLLVGRDTLTLIRDHENWRPRTIHDAPLTFAGVQVVYRPALGVDEWKLMRIAPLAERKARE